MSADIKYKITFHTYWHCGSGLASGSDADSLVIKDAKQMPYVPGKTIKGLVRDAAEDYLNFSKGSLGISDEDFDQAFGFFDDKENKKQGQLFFSDAELPTADQRELIENNFVPQLYRTISRTAISESTGVAKDHSLRKIEVTIPCTLIGEVKDVKDEKLAKLLVSAFQMIKRLGSNRNRGLGRCTIEIL